MVAPLQKFDPEPITDPVQLAAAEEQIRTWQALLNAQERHADSESTLVNGVASESRDLGVKSLVTVWEGLPEEKRLLVVAALLASIPLARLRDHLSGELQDALVAAFSANGRPSQEQPCSA